MKQNTLIDSSTLSETLIAGLQEKKGQDIVRIDLREVKSAVTDFFVICTATSDRQAQALADSVREFAKKEYGEHANGVEGYQAGEWILIDYVDVVVHIFVNDKREFYNIEELWGDGVIQNFED